MSTVKLSTKVTESISKLLVAHPFYAVLLLQLLQISETDGPTPGGQKVPTAGTDGVRLYINRKWFDKLNIDERVFVLAHEVTHVVYQHAKRAMAYVQRGIGPDLKPFSRGKYNRAADYVINDGLVKGGMKSMPVGGLLNPQFGYDDLVDEVYCKLDDEDGDKDGNGGGWDTHMDPGGDGSGGEEGPTEADIARALKSAEVTAKAQGRMPMGAQRLVDSYCEPQISWRDQIRMNIIGSAGRDSSTWARPNRKRMALPPHVYMPGTAAHKAGLVVLYGDTSGSVSELEWKHFFGEMAAIVEELNPEQCLIGSCDAVAYPPELVTCPEDVLSYKPLGGGGTHMPAIFERLEADEIHPDVLVILTDGYTDFDPAPPYEVIWVITSDVVAPFGKTVKINVTQ